MRLRREPNRPVYHAMPPGGQESAPTIAVSQPQGESQRRRAPLLIATKANWRRGLSVGQGRRSVFETASRATIFECLIPDRRSARIIRTLRSAALLYDGGDEFYDIGPRGQNPKIGTRQMPPSMNDSDSEDFAQGQYEPAQRKQMRQLQRQMKNTEAQKALARAMEKNGRYMLWSVILATASTLLAAAAVVFTMLYSLPRAPH
jgi:hypothetical protein